MTIPSKTNDAIFEHTLAYLEVNKQDLFQSSNSILQLINSRG